MVLGIVYLACGFATSTPWPTCMDAGSVKNKIWILLALARCAALKMYKLHDEVVGGQLTTICLPKL